ncbi:MAG: MFS transporter [Synergistaceae bacterium]|nr:MFS transporter [Synergistaceae bacterium]
MNNSVPENSNDISGSYKWMALSCTTLGALLSVLNTSTMMIALPTISKELNAGMEAIIWTVMGYMLVITILVPSIGRVADIYGRKKLYVYGFVVFTAAALFSGFAQNAWELLVFRLVQAAGGSLIMANSTAIVTDAFPKSELGLALGINSMVIAAGSTIGPILGGYLTMLGWRWIFWFNVPLGILGTIWAQWQLRELAQLPAGQKFDWMGTGLFTVGILAILLAITIGNILGWTSWPILTGLIGGTLLLVMFVIVENHTAQPMVDLELFEHRLLVCAYASNLLNGVARGAVTFLLIFFFQSVRGLTPLQAGILLTPFAIAMMVLAPISGALSDRYGSRGLSSLGLAITVVGLYGFTTIQADTPLSWLILWMVIMGAGSGFFTSPNTNAIMQAVPSERRGIAAGTRTMMNNIGMVISMALSMGIVSSSLDQGALIGLFTGMQEGGQGIIISGFIAGLHKAFWLSVGFSVFATAISLLRGTAADDTLDSVLR